MNTEVLSSRNVFIPLILIFTAQNHCANMDTVTVALIKTGSLSANFLTQRATPGTVGWFAGRTSNNSSNWYT
jgi:hypothetical protein